MELIKANVWQKGGPSPNPCGRPRKGRTISDLLALRLDKQARERFVTGLLEMTTDRYDPAIRIAASKLILGYSDGLPIARKEVDGEIREVRVTYVNTESGITGAPRGAVENCKTIEAPQCPGPGPEMG